jgi:hypothetical protein
MKELIERLAAKYGRKYVIYRLYLDGAIQYVGQTRDIRRRIAMHSVSKCFDEVGVTSHDQWARGLHHEEREAYMNYVEACEIIRLQPPLNKKGLSDVDFIEMFYALDLESKKHAMSKLPLSLV